MFGYVSNILPKTSAKLEKFRNKWRCCRAYFCSRKERAFPSAVLALWGRLCYIIVMIFMQAEAYLRLLTERTAEPLLET